MKSVAIVGYGLEGRGAYTHYLREGYDITICDQKTDLEVPTGTKTQLGPEYLKNLDRFDVIFRTSGMRPNIILAANPAIGAKITSVMNEFLAHCPTKNVIGVTGTKGKGTTSTLITKMLEAAGKRVFLGGNIGRSVFDFLPDLSPDDWVVLELSSFQLIDLHKSPHIAVCLMVVPEHLNWHADMAEYTDAKANLFKQQTATDTAIYFDQNEISKQIASHGQGNKIPYYTKPGAYVNAQSQIEINGTIICDTADLKLLGKHNWQNACAAVTAAWQVAQNVEAIKSVLTTFTGLEHRLELVRELKGVKYYDDSFGTTPETAIVAVQAFTEPKVLIVGGSDKGVPFDDLADAIVQNNVKHAITIGATGPAIATALRARGFTQITEDLNTMPEMIQTASSLAEVGDIVLLSTGCASFGLFRDYKDRGDQFKQAVQTLA